MLAYLLEKRANSNTEDHRASTSLHTTTNYGVEQAAKHLLIAGVNIDAQDWIGDTALHIALARSKGLLASMPVEYRAKMTLENDFDQRVYDVTQGSWVWKFLHRASKERISIVKP